MGIPEHLNCLLSNPYAGQKPTIRNRHGTKEWFQIRKREKRPEKIFEEKIAEKFPNVGQETVTQFQEAQRVPGKINPRKNITRHRVIKLTKVKHKEKC